MRILGCITTLILLEWSVVGFLRQVLSFRLIRENYEIGSMCVIADNRQTLHSSIWGVSCLGWNRLQCVVVYK